MVLFRRSNFFGGYGRKFWSIILIFSILSCRRLTYRIFRITLNLVIFTCIFLLTMLFLFVTSFTFLLALLYLCTSTSFVMGTIFRGLRRVILTRLCCRGTILCRLRRVILTRLCCIKVILLLFNLFLTSANYRASYWPSFSMSLVMVYRINWCLYVLLP